MKSYIVTIVTDGHQTVLYKLSAELCSRNKRTATRDKTCCLKNTLLHLLRAVLHLIYENDMMRDANTYGQHFQYEGCWNQCDPSVLVLTPSKFLDTKSYPVYRECIIYRMNRNLSAIYLTIFSQDRHGAASLCLLTIIPRARMGSESMRAKGIIVLVKSK